jgi:ABC-type maltose transport system permease subunit
MKTCLAICGVYAAISVVAVVMEVYALMALQFCDGEDLMPLYWSTWTMMQVGSVIAIFGILLAISNSLRGRKNP